MNNFLKGSKLAIPIMLGYFPIAFSFGVLASYNGFSAFGAGVMSAAVFAGAAQFLAVDMISSSGPLEIGFIVFLLNLRHLVMTYSLSPRVKHLSVFERVTLFSGITDENYALISFSKEPCLKTWAGLTGLVLCCYLAWFSGSVVGVAFSSAIPEDANKSMGFAFHAMFIGLLVNALKKEPKYLTLTMLTVASNFALSHFFPPTLALFACITIIPAIYVFFRKPAA